jgi:hypothetical protein
VPFRPFDQDLLELVRWDKMPTGKVQALDLSRREPPGDSRPTQACAVDDLLNRQKQSPSWHRIHNETSLNVIDSRVNTESGLT